jgi:hypothetical protein
MLGLLHVEGAAGGNHPIVGGMVGHGSLSYVLNNSNNFG